MYENLKKSSFKLIVDRLNQAIDHLSLTGDPGELYEPILYTMQNGGKRIRPTLALLSYQLFSNDTEQAIKPALAIELFHNFTLIHDDIIDEAPLRRGKPSVHNKWGGNIAILSGDAMVFKAYQLFEGLSPSTLSTVIPLFTKTALDVMEGQQMDMNYETSDNVSVDDYLTMISKKTAALMGFSLQMGAIIAGAGQREAEKLKNVGVNLGIGFQLKDDLLDVYADNKKFGKQVGGDIISNKKTFLLIKALESSNNGLENELNYWLSLKDFNPHDKVQGVTTIYNKLDIKNIANAKIDEFFNKCFETLKLVQVDGSKKEALIEFIEYMINRDS